MHDFFNFSLQRKKRYIFFSPMKFGDWAVKRVCIFSLEFLTSIQCVMVVLYCQLEGVCFYFLHPWCAVKLTKWRNVTCEFIHGAFKGEFICQQVIGWPSIILFQTACLHCHMVELIISSSFLFLLSLCIFKALRFPATQGPQTYKTH